MTLEQAQWSVFEALARIATRGTIARITGVHSISPQDDGTANVWFDISPAHVEHNGVQGGLILAIDQSELMRVDGPEQLLEYISGGLETRH
jgi:hypothetical protein